MCCRLIRYSGVRHLPPIFCHINVYLKLTSVWRCSRTLDTLHRSITPYPYHVSHTPHLHSSNHISSPLPSSPSPLGPQSIAENQRAKARELHPLGASEHPGGPVEEESLHREREQGPKSVECCSIFRSGSC
jgi:hypothetical protein